MAHNFPEKEQEILKFWDDRQIFQKSLNPKGKTPFVFYDGPPFATGTPHYGHLLQSAVKDAIPRYKTMRGFYVARQWGWDCHGLPIENIVEKEIGTKTKKDILAMGVKQFNDLCRERVFTFIHEWEQVIGRFGRWADMKNPYRTMDFAYMQSEWWAFKQLYDKGLIYEDYRSMHICPRCETTLSQGEVADGYRNVKDLSVTVKFKVKNPDKHGLPTNSYFLAWTTTPWTLPGNVALAVGEDISYVIAQKDGENLIFAKVRLNDVLGEQAQQYHLVNERRGKSLAGIAYEPLFDYYNSDANLKNRENGWKVYAADFVTADEGTGIAHEAPAFGADDWALLKKYNLPFVQHVTMSGAFKPEVKDFVGMSLIPRAKNDPDEIREADLAVVKFLDSKGLVFGHNKYEHSYPHCWRCDTALLNYATRSWFVAVEKLKPKLLKTAKKINWIPEHIKAGRFGQWLEGARDWSISRQRFWANTIPVWRCETCKKETVFGSADELEKASGAKVVDLHKDVVDEVTFACGCGGVMRRVPDVLDTWFDSGSVPFAALHYPFENQGETKKRLPADFIGEAQDQTRAWFYYQHVLVGALFGREAFKNCVVTGIVLAEDGKKMAKKLRNYPDPMEVIEKYGADAMRFYMLSSPAVQAENLSFSEKGVAEIAGKNIGRLLNVLEFYKLYEDGTKADEKSKHVLDRWILARLAELEAAVTAGYEAYRMDSATRPVTGFIDDLSSWYLRRSRERFKEEGDDKKAALATTRFVLAQLAKVIAPAMPFAAEYVFGAVRKPDEPESVHLSQWPASGKKSADAAVLNEMEKVRAIVAMALALRTELGIRVRQPLAKLTVKNAVLKITDAELLALARDEVNVKEIAFDGTIEKDVALDTQLTEDLKEEGMVRDLVRLVQDFRKEQGLKPDDAVAVWIAGSAAANGILEKRRGSLAGEIRASRLHIGAAVPDSAPQKQAALSGEPVTIAIINPSP